MKFELLTVFIAFAAAGLWPAAPAFAADGADDSRADFAASVREKLADERVVRSADGLVLVQSPADISGADALTLLRFVGDVRTRLGRLLDTRLDDERYTVRLIVHPLADGESPGVDCFTVLGTPPAILKTVVAGLEQVDPREVAAALCRGFLRVNAMETDWRDPDGEAHGPLPPDPDRFKHLPYPKWFGTGCARLLDQSARQDDAESAIARLDAGNLPPVAELLAMNGSAAEADPALAAQLVAWLLDSSPRYARFQALRKAVVGDNGTGHWTPAAVFAVAAETDDPVEADAVWRRWLSDRRWAILTPGSSHPAFLRRLRGLLALMPPSPPSPVVADGAESETATNPEAGEAGEVPPELAVQPDVLSRIPRAAFEENGGTILPEALVLHSDADWAPHAAMAMSGRLLRVAAGHGDDVLAAARAYGEFFEAVRARKPRGDLARLLLDADGRLQALEHRADAEQPTP